MLSLDQLSPFGEVALWGARLLILFGSIVLHEIAHGYAALKMGDKTAQYAGRLTLNPLKHIDPFGTIILPSIMLIASGGSFAFGYAKPVPINPARFRSQRTGLLITGIAGPATNVIIAIVAGLGVRLMVSLGIASTALGSVIVILFYYAAMMNLVLAFFNLIPIPPLDGSRVLQRFLPRKALEFYDRLESFGFVIVIAISYFLPSVFDVYLSLTAFPLVSVLTGI